MAHDTQGGGNSAIGRRAAVGRREPSRHVSILQQIDKNMLYLICMQIDVTLQHLCRIFLILYGRL
jgi:hypothetical protein